MPVTDLSRFKTKPRPPPGGVATLKSRVPAKKRRAPFEARWAKLPRYWAVALQRITQANTFKLAMKILLEAANLELRNERGERIVLSKAMTGIPRNSRRRAIQELVKLDLIDVEQHGKEAPRALPKHIPAK